MVSGTGTRSIPGGTVPPMDTRKPIGAALIFLGTERLPLRLGQLDVPAPASGRKRDPAISILRRVSAHSDGSSFSTLSLVRPVVRHSTPEAVGRPTTRDVRGSWPIITKASRRPPAAYFTLSGVPASELCQQQAAPVHDRRTWCRVSYHATDTDVRG